MSDESTPQEQAHRLRELGWTHKAIADELGVSTTAIWRWLHPQEAAAESRARAAQKAAWARRKRQKRDAEWKVRHEGYLRPGLLPIYKNGEHSGHTKVDQDVWEELKYVKLFDHPLGYVQVSVTATGGNANGGPRMLHRWILGLEMHDGRHSDHINRDKRDNRRANLRVCTHAENSQNRVHPNQFGMRGVRRAGGRYSANATLNGECIIIGYFDTPEAAGAAASAWRAEHMPFSPDAREAA